MLKLNSLILFADLRSKNKNNISIIFAITGTIDEPLPLFDDECDLNMSSFDVA